MLYTLATDTEALVSLLDQDASALPMGSLVDQSSVLRP